MLPENDNVIAVDDKIGKMECFSGLFRQTLMNVLEATNTVDIPLGSDHGNYLK